MTNVVFVVFRRQGCVHARIFFLHILDRTPQTEVHAENQLPRYPRSGLKVCVGWWVGGGLWVGGKPNLVNSIDLWSS